MAVMLKNILEQFNPRICHCTSAINLKRPIKFEISKDAGGGGHTLALPHPPFEISSLVARVFSLTLATPMCYIIVQKHLSVH